MRQAKRAVNQVFMVVIASVLVVSVISYLNQDFLSPIFDWQAQNRVQQEQEYAARPQPVQEKTPTIAEAKIATTAPSVLAISTGSKCPNPKGTCTSDIVNSYILDKYGYTDDDIVKNTEIGFNSNGIKVVFEGNPTGGKAQFCGIKDTKHIAMAMRLTEPPILPNFYKKGVENGLPIRGEGGTITQNRAYIPTTLQNIAIDDLPFYCRYNNNAYRTLLQGNLQTPLGGDGTGMKGSPSFWLGCDTITKTKAPQPDLYSNEESKKRTAINQTWERVKKDDTRADGSPKITVANRISWSSAAGLPVEGKTKGIYGGSGWTFDSTGKGAAAMPSEAFNVNAPPAGAAKDRLLARTNNLSVDYLSKQVLDLLFTNGAYVFASSQEKNNSSKLSYDPTSQKNEMCDIDKGECPLVPAEAQCFTPFYLKVAAIPGILQINSTPDYITNASSQKAMQRALNVSLSSVDAPSGIFERATRDDIILASSSSKVSATCNGKFVRSPNLTDAEFNQLKEYYRTSRISKSAAVFYTIPAEFKGDIATGLLKFIASLTIKGDVIAFTVLPTQNLTMYRNFNPHTEQITKAAEPFRDTVMKESGLTPLDFSVRCEGDEVKVEFNNIK